MLIITRHRGEKIFIGDDIVIVVAGIREGKVRLGIVAPGGVEIKRDELVPADDPRRANEPKR